MRLKYKYIHFVDALNADKNPSYICYNNKTDAVLAWIEYYKPWKQYVFEGSPGCVFNVSCLADIIAFMKQIKIDQVLKGADEKRR